MAPSGQDRRSKIHVEAYVSAIQPCAQAPPRFPFAYGNQSRSQDPERPPRPRSEVAQRLNSVVVSNKTPPLSTASAGAFSVLKPLVTLTQRADFLSAARARRIPMPAFLLQARKRSDGEAPDTPQAIRIGYTCSKKVGNAVARNRAKRRLREIARAVIPLTGRDGWDYVLIGRKNATATRDFQDLLEDLSKAMGKVHG